MAGEDLRADARLGAEGLRDIAAELERVERAATAAAVSSGPGGDTAPGATLDRVNAPAANAVGSGPGEARQPGVTATQLQRVERQNEAVLKQIEGFRQEAAARDRELRRREEERDRRRELAEQRNRPANGIAPGVFIDSTLLL